jgi:hypothetical protein
MSLARVGFSRSNVSIGNSIRGQLGLSGRESDFFFSDLFSFRPTFALLSNIVEFLIG